MENVFINSKKKLRNNKKAALKVEIVTLFIRIILITSQFLLFWALKIDNKKFLYEFAASDFLKAAAVLFVSLILDIFIFSPVKYGKYRYYYMVVCGEMPELKSLFFHFKNRYLDTVKYRIVILIKSTVVCVVALMPITALKLIGNLVRTQVDSVDNASGILFALTIITIPIVLLSVVMAVSYMLRWAPVPYMVVENSPQKGKFKAARKIMQKNISTALILYFKLFLIQLSYVLVAPFFLFSPLVGTIKAQNVRNLAHKYKLETKK